MFKYKLINVDSNDSNKRRQHDLKYLRAITFLLLFIFFIFILLNLNNFKLDKKCDLKVSYNTLSKIKINGKWFVDENERVILFHGINAVKKSYPWIPDEAYNNLRNQTHLDNLKRWGFNTIRLGFMWSGLMPSKDYINQTYLNEMVNIVNSLARNNFYVIIDLHQDMMSSRFASYDGVPLWLLDEMPNSRFEFPWPLKNETLNMSVFAAYITEPCSFAFQCLYKNVNSFQDYFLQYWQIVSETFVDYPNILGYELLNEPWAGDVYGNPLLLLPSMAGRMNLLPLYDRAYQTIRKYDKKTLIFYEPVTWGVLFNRNYFGTGFNRPPGNDANTTVLSWHYYCWLLQFIDNPLVNNTYPLFDKVVCDHLLLKLSYETVKSDLVSNLGNGPSFLTEFGVCAYKLNDTNGLNEGEEYNYEECDAVLNENDKYLLSWTYWDSNFYLSDKTFKINNQMLDRFSRVYPLATNGSPKLMRYNVTSKEFKYEYEIDFNVLNQAYIQTEIFIPPHAYPKGFTVKLSTHLAWSYNNNTNILYIGLSEKTLKKLETLNGKSFRFQVESRISLKPNDSKQ